MNKDELKNKCTERAKIFQQAMESCHSSSPIDCIEWFADSIADLEKENAELKAQIEKMKCCSMCKHFDFNEPNYCHKGVYRERQYVCSKWEFGN